MFTMFLNENISQIFLGFILGVIIYSLFSYFINVWRSHRKFSKEKLKNNQNSKEEVESENPSAESDSERVDFTDENGYRRHIRRQIPSEFYEPSDRPPIPEHLRPEIFHVLHHLEMLELPSSWQLKPEDVEVKSYRAKEYIVRPGDPLDSMYVAVEGELQINIMLTGRKSRQYPVKIITQGGCFFSVLSILDALKDAPPIKNLTSLRAATDCRVAKYSFASFRSAMLERPADWLRPVQVVITRLRHVTLATLHTYMGFNWQLLNQNRLCPTETVYANYLKIPKESRLEKACEWLADALGIREKASVLRNLVSLEEFPVGTVLVKQNTRDEDLFFLLSGSFLICRENDEEDEKVGDEYQDHVKSTGIRVFPGELLPSMQLLTDERAVYSLIAESDSTLVVMRREKFSKFLESHPQVYVPIAHNILRFLSPFVRSVDFALEWLRVDSGQAIYRAGEIADTMYIVLSGRLRSVEKKTVLEEFGKGDVLGLMEMTEKKNRASTVLAVRFSQLACIPQGLLNYFKLTHPEVGVRLIQLLRKCWKQPFSVSSLPQVPADAGPTSFRHNKNLRTIALVPACADVPLVAFTCEFYNALSAHLKVLRISSTQLNARFSSNVLEKKFDFMLMQYLNVQENSYPLIIYECDFGPTAWTSRCLRQADAVIVVGLGDRPPEDQALATQLLAANERVIRSNKELVILWPDKTRSPSNTGKWLRYSFFSGHHHVRAPERMYQFGTNCDEKTIIKYYEKHVFGVTDPLSDFARLARIFTGNAVGIVLGGGGARGAAHAGVMRAILEQGIPVDLIGGTSIGSLFAGMFAGSPNKKAFQRFHDFFSAINVLWRTIFLDLTYAHSAFLTGVRFNRVVEDQFKKTEIEDLWISYFCVSTDLTTSKMRIHRSGLLWPLVRASMTIAGYLPPLCDPSDGHLLVDGAYVNNLPADVMRSLGARVVIAVDVGVTDKNLGTNYGVSLNGFWVLFKKIFPLGEPIKVLNMSEIQNRLAFVCCEKQLEEIKKAPYCHYFRPPIESFDPSDFSQFNVAADIGYAYAITRLKDLMSNEKTRAELLGSVVQTFFERRRFVPNMRDKFTRMAASISKVPRLPLTCSSSSDLSQKGSSKSDSESTNSTQFS